jgi:signal transduction histidine kinase
MYKVLFITDKTPKIKSKEIKLIHKFNHLLLNSFSHELRTPLNCSFQLLEALMMEIQDRNLLDNYIQPIISSNHLLLHQINDILDYASFESDNFQYTNQKFELVQLARRVTEIFRYGCECKQISITTESNFDTIYLSNDPKRIS